MRRNPVRGAVGRGGDQPGQRARPGEIERTVTAFARASNGGLIVTTSALTVVHRDLIITLAAKHKRFENEKTQGRAFAGQRSD
jgi:hypothetical protein